MYIKITYAYTYLCMYLLMYVMAAKSDTTYTETNCFIVAFLQIHALGDNHSSFKIKQQ